MLEGNDHRSRPSSRRKHADVGQAVATTAVDVEKRGGIQGEHRLGLDVRD